jgi:GTP-binding protein
MFCDEVTFKAIAGQGGNGVVSFRKMAYLPKGGPDGGDGGKGGDIILKANPNINTLYDYKSQNFFYAENGVAGAKNDCRGRGGEDLTLEVPVGTKVYNQETQELIFDINQPNSSYVVVKGGRGGYGNAHFVSSTRQAPRFAELGEPGEELELRLELNLVADVGIIGFPSAGKSTLISVISNAKPKTAAYHFTTLVPNLGVVTLDKFGGNKKQNFVVADIPGLIEGASEGKGLGISFLKHIKRTAGLIHLIDVTDPDFISKYKKINLELQRFDKELSNRKQFVVLNKIDSITDEDTQTGIDLLKSEYPEIKKVYAISAVSHLGLKELVIDVFNWIQENKSKIQEEFFHDEEQPDHKVYSPHLEDPKRNLISTEGTIEKNDRYTNEKYEAKIFRVSGTRIEQIAVMTDYTNHEAVNRIFDVFKKMGIDKMLKANGAKHGDVIRIGKNEIIFRG